MQSINKQKIPLYKQAREGILEIIVNKNLKAHDLLPTEEELATQFNVSKMTIKLALKALEDEGIIYRLPRRGSFVSDSDVKDIQQLIAPTPVNKTEVNNNNLILVVLPVIDNFTGEILTCIENEAKKNNYDVIIKISGGNLVVEEGILLDALNFKTIKGIILFPGDRKVCGNTLLKLKLLNYPIVIIDRVFKEVSFDSVYHDHYQGAYNMTEYLIKKGHQEIGFVTEDLSNALSRNERYQGYIHAMMDNQVLLNNNYIMILNKDWKKADNINRITDGTNFKEYLTMNKKITAVFCSNDYLATDMLYTALKLNISVPNDLSITGFSDNKILRYLPIKITTVRQPIEEFAESTIKVMIFRMNNLDANIQTIKVPTEIIERNSVKTIKAIK